MYLNLLNMLATVFCAAAFSEAYWVGGEYATLTLWITGILTFLNAFCVMSRLWFLELFYQQMKDD